MSSAFAIAGVTAMLRTLLDNALGGLGQVTSKPPDLMQTSQDEAAQLNLFLRQVTPNAAWRNAGLPGWDPSGRDRLGNPPLALNLHYMLSAHGAASLHPEMLLGHAMQALHEHPLLTADDLQAALNGMSAGDPLKPHLAQAGLEEQREPLRITPEFLSTEETSKFWSSTLAHYRPCAAYVVSVVLIQAKKPALIPRPVLTRNVTLVSRVPTLERVVYRPGDPGALVGTPVELLGHALGGSGQTVRLQNERFAIDREIPVDSAQNGALTFTVPSSPSDAFAVGVYRVSALLPSTEPGAPDGPVETNSLALVLAPQVTNVTITVTNGTAGITVEFAPELRPDQRLSLFLGSRECQPELSLVPSTAHFIVEHVASGTHLVRLRIDGIDSSVVTRTSPLGVHEVVVP